MSLDDGTIDAKQYKRRIHRSPFLFKGSKQQTTTKGSSKQTSSSKMNAIKKVIFVGLLSLLSVK